MSAHLILDPPTDTTTDPAATDPGAAPAAVATVVSVTTAREEAGWRDFSIAVTDEAAVIADRDDLLVTVAPGAGRGAPACFLPALASIEVDGTHLGGIDPATADPCEITDRARYGAAWGLLTHECAHAAHTRWEPPADAAPAAVAAALLLEESRIEARQITRRPDDRQWLRAAVHALILAEDPAPAPGGAAGRAHAAQAAALLLARVDAGILTDAETEPIRDAASTCLSADTLAELQVLWRFAHTVDDTDAETMLDLGRQWCTVLGTDTPGPTDSALGVPAPAAGDDPAREASGPDAASAAMAEAVTESLGRVRLMVASERADTLAAAPTPGADASTGEDEADQARRAEVARKVFRRSAGPRTGATKLAGTRPPTDAERTAARRVARTLSTAGVRDRVKTTTTSALPPGRLRMRGALAADAQRAARAMPTAEPFTRTTRRPVPTPPLRLGIACDVSGSMHEFAAPVASAAWILAHAAHHTHVPATTATVVFGNHVRAITRPDSPPAEVTEFEALDNYEAIDTALDALDGALGLSRPGAARLLVIVSDGQFRARPREGAQTRLDALRASGCGVLWLAPSQEWPPNEPLHGATVHQLADPTSTAQAIARAATTALRATT